MKSNSYISKLLFGLLLIAFAVTLGSCASKQPDEPETFEEAAAAEEAAAEEGVETALDEAEEASDDGLGSLEEEGDKGMKELEDELAALDESAEELLGENEGEKAEITEEKVGAEEGADEALAGLESEEGEPEEVAEAGDDLGLDDDSGLDDLGLDEETTDEAIPGTEVAQNEEPASESVETFEAEEPASSPEPTSEPAFESPAPVAAAPTFVDSKTPVIPDEAFIKNGVLLNRFYFVRRGDTAESISSLIFGTSSKAGDLAALNGGTRRLRRAGTLIFYQSPKSPSDERVSSFYQEANIQAEEHVVGRGEWLSLIAKKKYGDLRSWKELAVVNGLSDPDEVSRGQKLFAYPADLTTQTQLAQVDEPIVDSQPVAEPEQVDSQPEIEEPPAIEPEPPTVAANDPMAEKLPDDVPPADPPKAMPPKPMPPKAMAPKPMPPKKQMPPPTRVSAEGEFDFMTIVQQNLLVIALGGAILLLVIALLLVNKRRRARAGDDFAEQDYVEPPKAKRR